MRPFLSLSFSFAAVLMTAPQCCAQIDAQKALTQIGDFMVGSWTPASQQDKDAPLKHVYTWALNKKFVRTNGELDPEPWHGYMGVDLESNQLGWWGFFADGTSGVLYLKKLEESEWVFDGSDFGPKGKFRRVVTIKPGDGKLHSKIEDTLNGETTVIEEDWVRHR